MHEKCPYPGCTFSAIEKVLKDHISSVHKTGEDKIPPSLLELIPEKQAYLAYNDQISLCCDDWQQPGRHSQVVIRQEINCRWREERKRRYPTQKNIEEKKNAQQAIEDAGGLAEHEDKRLKDSAQSFPTFTTLLHVG